ncbi:hypothetical protein D9611_009111 [Ephemerocybe angulata]|uniref:Uncharacterized protein n=1 Tax=Ephemerocybe angulata TaxID=980116 RepID=A0A8H5FJQ5_9AGAR|nr:hypothetical protein D9611_009111 [Tulosesus angulatus]
MLQGRPRQAIKDLLVKSRIKVVFDRITLTRYTRFYFFVSAFTCLLLCSLQAVLLADNTKGVDILTKVVDEAQLQPHVTVLKDGELQVCDRIPDKSDDGCIVLWLSDRSEQTRLSKSQRTRRGSKLRRRQAPAPAEVESDDSDDEGVESSDDEGEESDDEDDAAPSQSSTSNPASTSASTSTSTSTSPSGSGSTTTVVSSTTSPTGSTSVSISTGTSPSSTITVVFPSPTATSPPEADTTGTPREGGITLNQGSNSSSSQSLSCIYSLSWIEEVLHDSQREDAATLFFQIWLFGIGVVAILNESIPHLTAAFLGHILSAGWSSSRILSSKHLASFYREAIVAGPCKGTDLLGSWWEMRLAHTIPVAVFNIVSLIALTFLSWKLLKVYNYATFSRVGPTRTVQRVYRLVLLFSVGLQLSSFFTAASTGLWIAKAAHGNFKALAVHGNLYIAAFVVVLVAEIPWLFLGWNCVRKESNKRFIGFIVLSTLLIGTLGAMFSSNLYRTIFMEWRFFATMTITSFIFLVLTTAVGLACYYNFGKGLAHYLQVTEALEGEGFTPVLFDNEKALPPPGQAPFEGFYATSEKDDIEWTLPSSQADARTLSSMEFNSQGSLTNGTRQLVVDRNTNLSPDARNNLKSVWSANSSEIDTIGPGPLYPAYIGGGNGVHLQLHSPSPSLHSGERVKSGVSSLVPFQGMPYPARSSVIDMPLPAAAPTHTGRQSVSSISSDTIRSSPTPIHVSAPSVEIQRTPSTRSIKKSPFPTAPIRQLSLPGYANPFEDVPSGVRGSVAEGSIFSQEVPRPLFVTNGLGTPNTIR